MKSYKAKLHRSIAVYAADDKTIVYEREGYIRAQKFAVDVKAREQKFSHIFFKLPDQERADDIDKEGQNPVLQANAKNFSPSHYEGIFTIHYSLDVFVKHKSVTEFGMGNSVKFDIKIKQSSMEIPSLSAY